MLGDRLGSLSQKSKIGLGLGGVGLLGLAFSAKDDHYNTIEGLRHGGMAQGIRRSHTDFGSGYRGLPDSLMGVSLDRRILDYRKDVIETGGIKDVESDIAARQKKQLGSIASFENTDFEKSRFQRRYLEGLSAGQGQLKDVKLDKFDMEVEDADTLILKRKGLSGLFSDPIQIRLAGIDAPETTAHEGDPLAPVRYEQDQPYGEKASDALRQLISQQDNISLKVGTEKTYGRYVGALVGDDSVLNVDLARMGAVAALPFGKVTEDVVSRGAVERAQQEAQSQDKGIWSMARYKAIDKVQDTVGQSITFNTLSRIDKLSHNLNLGAYSSLIEGMGSQERDLSYKEEETAARIGRALRKSHGPKKRGYNKFEGLHPGSQGMGAQSMRRHSEFGSGWKGLFGGGDATQAGVETYGEYTSYKEYKASKRIDKALGKERLNELGRDSNWVGSTRGARIFNYIAGLHPFSEGMGAKAVQDSSDFGSPVKELASRKSFNMLRTLFRGTTKEVGTHKPMIALDKLDDANRAVEVFFEDLRKKEFKDRPSRLASSYWSPVENIANKYAKGEKGTLSSVAVKEKDMFITDNTFYIQGGLSLHDPFGGGEQSAANFARKYWKGISYDKAMNIQSPEVLLPGITRATKMWPKKSNTAIQEIAGLHPGSEGIGTNKVRELTDFGSPASMSKILKRAAGMFKRKPKTALQKLSKGQDITKVIREAGYDVFEKDTDSIKAYASRLIEATGTNPKHLEATAAAIGKSNFAQGSYQGGGVLAGTKDYYTSKAKDIIKSNEMFAGSSVEAVASKYRDITLMHEFLEVEATKSISAEFGRGSISSLRFGSHASKSIISKEARYAEAMGAEHYDILKTMRHMEITGKVGASEIAENMAKRKLVDPQWRGEVLKDIRKAESKYRAAPEDAPYLKELEQHIDFKRRTNYDMAVAEIYDRPRAVIRNKKFAKASQEAVGVGLRAAKNAKGSGGFSSTQSWN